MNVTGRLVAIAMAFLWYACSHSMPGMDVVVFGPAWQLRCGKGVPYNEVQQLQLRMSMTIERGDAGSSGDVEVLVEVSAVGAGQGGDLRRGVSLAPVSFASRADDVADALLEIARRMRGRLQSADDDGDAAEPARLARDGEAGQDGKSWGLDEVQLNFQLALQADAGVVIAKASTSATFSATMTWRRT